MGYDSSYLIISKSSVEIPSPCNLLVIKFCIIEYAEAARLKDYKVKGSMGVFDPIILCVTKAPLIGFGIKQCGHAGWQ